MSEQPASTAEEIEPYDPDRTRFLAATVLWVTAAGLSVAAAFAGVYSAGGNTLDAWGRFRGSVVESSVVHGPRYGVVFVAVAVVFLVCAGSALTRLLHRRPARLDGAFLVTGVGVATLLAGVVVALYLDVTSRLDGLRANQRALYGLKQSFVQTISTSIGACAYLGVAAVVCGALACVAAGPRRPADQSADRSADYPAEQPPGLPTA